MFYWHVLWLPLEDFLLYQSHLAPNLELLTWLLWQPAVGNMEYSTIVIATRAGSFLRPLISAVHRKRALFQIIVTWTLTATLNGLGRVPSNFNCCSAPVSRRNSVPSHETMATQLKQAMVKIMAMNNLLQWPVMATSWQKEAVLHHVWVCVNQLTAEFFALEVSFSLRML